MFRSTNSTGAALLLWLAGTLYATAGVVIYVEYGLSVPRWVVDGAKIAVPRSGGDLNYVSYVRLLNSYFANYLLAEICVPMARLSKGYWAVCHCGIRNCFHLLRYNGWQRNQLWDTVE
jgi:hypothetical protein